MMRTDYTCTDFARDPLLVFYEITRACDLACAHCRACAQPKRHPHELTPTQSRALVDDLGQFDKTPLLVLTGGDPLKREDVFDLTAYATQRGIRVAMTPSATPLVTRAALQRLKSAGLSRLALSLDGVDATTHDAFRRVEGSYDRTFEILADARAVGLPLQINTTVTQRNFAQLDALAGMLATQGVVLWSVFFLIPVGRGLAEQRLSAEQCEQVFAILWRNAQSQPYGIKTTEAPHYRRYVLERWGDPQRPRKGLSVDGLQRAPLGVNDGKGVMFVSHTGQVFPSGFMPIECGRFPRESIVNVYRHSTVMRQMQVPDALHGKCGVCEYRHICGGSRARAYALTRDRLASEPDCLYIPRSLQGRPADQREHRPVESSTLPL